MHEPGPPRATSVGESVELAPRNPDPSGEYGWTLRSVPAGSAAAVDTTPGDVRDGVLRAGETTRRDDPVVHLHPDAPGTYVLELDAPDGTHRQRVRAFPDERRPIELRVPAADLPVDDPASVDRVSLMWARNDRLLARDRPERDGDDWVIETRAPPGRHGFGFAVDDDLTDQHRDGVEVPGPGRPRLTLDGVPLDADGEEVVAGTGADAGTAATDTDAGTAAGDTDAATLRITADVAVPPGSGTDPADVDVAFLLDDRDVDPETAARIEAHADGHVLSVPLAELSGSVRVHAVPHAERYGAIDTVRLDLGEDGDREPVSVVDPHERPAWAASPTIYEVFVRSFAGDTLPTTFREIERRVPYVESLGVDVLWLTPVLASPTDHGYHVTDFAETAADLGPREAFESLVDRCHEAGIRVVFDLVINHTSRDHPAFQLHAAGVDAYRDHYRRTDGAFDVTDTDWASLDPGDMPEYYFNWRRIPNLNFDSPTVRAWLLDVVDDWAAVVDGFRADVAWGVPHGFWKEVADRVPDDVLLLDETLPHDPFYGEGEFDLHYDTSLYGTLRGIGAGDESADAVADALDRATWLGFDDPGVQMRYVENHDEDRYLAAHGEAALRAAAAVTFTLPGAPMVYAGQERGNVSTRGPMRWHDGDNALTDYHRDLSVLRATQPALREGEVAFDGAAAAVAVDDGDAERVTAYLRRREGGTTDGEEDTAADRLLVVVNFDPEPATVTVPAGFDRDLFSGERVDGERIRVDSVAVIE